MEFYLSVLEVDFSVAVIHQLFDYTRSGVATYTGQVKWGFTTTILEVDLSVRMSQEQYGTFREIVSGSQVKWSFTVLICKINLNVRVGQK